MSSVLWDTFVGAGVETSTRLADATTTLVADAAAASDLARSAFGIAAQSLLMGASEVGRLAQSIETALDLVASGGLEAAIAGPIIASSTETLRQAFAELDAADASGARVEGTPVEAARYELETLFPLDRPRTTLGQPDVPVANLRKKTSAAPESSPGPAPASGSSVWVPTVGSDMVELFFEEANDRLEALSVKLLDIEKRPDDPEILREVFRDMHTIKGSSAMVGLSPMNALAHAAEDLVGQLRDGDRNADRPVIDALLAALDRLQEIAASAQAGAPIAEAHDDVVRRLRDPSAAPSPTDASTATATNVSAPAPQAAKGTSSASPRQTIRVDFDKLDNLMNLVGELVLGRDGLGSAIGALSAMSTEVGSGRQLSQQIRAVASGTVSDTNRTQIGELGDEVSRVERVLSEIAGDLDHASGRLDGISAQLRDSVMSLRMIPVGGVFRKHHRTVRDLAAGLGKKVGLELAGEDTELDKLLVEALDEPLMHLVRNSVDHGIEMPDVRQRAGKDPSGTVRIAAMHRGSQVVIRVSDDGAGIDVRKVVARALERNIASREEIDSMSEREAIDLLFRPGFSTADVVSEVSGRGVGMDVVRQSIVSRLKGSIDVDTELGAGTSFVLRLPLTLAISNVLLARAGGETLAIPLGAVVRTISASPGQIQMIQSREVLPVQGRQVPLLRLSEILHLDSSRDDTGQLQVVLTEHADELYGLVVDAMIGRKEIVIKSLGDLLETVPFCAGATLLGDRCALILDVSEVVSSGLRQGSSPPPPPKQAAAEGEKGHRILIVEDSDIVRESLRRLLADSGYQTTVAHDGVEGLEAAMSGEFDLISTDVMMPRMDGYELTRALRASDKHRNTPIVMVTSRGERIDRVRGFDAGVDEYITKPHDRHLLARTVAKLLGGEGGKP